MVDDFFDDKTKNRNSRTNRQILKKLKDAFIKPENLGPEGMRGIMGQVPIRINKYTLGEKVLKGQVTTKSSI